MYEFIFLSLYRAVVLVTVAEGRIIYCHPRKNGGPKRKRWIPAFAGMTNTVSATGTI